MHQRKSGNVPLTGSGNVPLRGIPKPVPRRTLSTPVPNRVTPTPRRTLSTPGPNTILQTPPQIDLSKLLGMPDEVGVKVLSLLPIKELTRLLVFNKPLTQKYWPYFEADIRKEVLRRRLAKFVNVEVSECSDYNDFAEEFLYDYLNEFDKEQLIRVMLRVFNKLYTQDIPRIKFESGEDFEDVKSSADDYANSKCYENSTLEDLYEIIKHNNMVPLFERSFDHIEEFRGFIPK